ncbi:MAG: hypothetical protein VB862_12970, partial [Pirellulaceae bacterium]
MKNCTILTIVMVLTLPGRVSCAQVDIELAEPRQQKLVVGTKVFKPLVYRVNDELMGFSIELLQALAEQL